MEYCVLGSVEAISEGRPVPIAAGKQRMLLCCLLLEPNRVVPADRLIDQLWGARPPATAAKNLQVLISQLRKSLAAGGPDPISTGGGGYMLRVPPGGTDVDRFEQLLATARGEFAAGHPRDAGLTLDRALSLWRGRPYEDVAYEDFARDEIARLEERRAGAEEDRADALLASGRHVEAIAGLEKLVATHPYRERPIGQLMLALHRSGRRAEALQTFDAARLRLAEELGIDPGERLRSLHAAMLSSAGDGEDAPADELAAPPGRRRRRLMAVGVCLVLAAVVAAVVAITRSDGGAHIMSVSGNSLAVIDAGSGQVVAQYGVGDTPTAVASNGRIAWTLNADAGTVSRVDLGSGASITRSPGVTPTDLAFGGGRLWVGYVDRNQQSYQAGVLELDPGTLTTVRRSKLQAGGPLVGSVGSSTLVAWGAGAIYATQPDGTIARLDPGKLTVTATSRSSTNAFAVTDDAVWEVPGWERTFGNQDARRPGSLLRLDPRTLRVTDSLPVPWTTGIFDLASGAGAIWGAEPRSGLVWRIDPAPPGSARTIRVGLSANALTFGGGSVWAADGADGSIVRIDPESEQVTRIDIGPAAPQGVAFAGGRAMVTVAGASTCAPMLQQGTGPPDLVIVSDLDLSPNVSPLTRPIVRAIKDTLRRHGYRAGRFRIGYRSCDDSTAQTGVASAGKCQANARSYAEDASVVAVIGTFNSDCASAELPILNGAGPQPVAMISATNSFVGLTKKAPGALVGEPEMYSPTGVRSYFRVYPADDRPAAAEAVLAQRLGVQGVGVLVRTPRADPDFAVAQTSMQWFVGAATSLGLPTVSPGTELSSRGSANVLARRLAARGVNAIAVDQLDQRAIDVIVALQHRVGAVTVWAAVSASYLYQQPAVALQHLLGPGVRLYVAAPQIDGADQLPEAGQAFMREFGGPQPQLADHAFVPYAAQAAETLLQAIADSDGSRRSAIEQLRRITVRGGILGDFGFDRNGDTSVSSIPVYTIAMTAEGPTWRVVVVDVPSTISG